MPAAELAVFRTNLSYARQLASTEAALQPAVTRALDLTDLLRAALVQGVSAFDHFVHEEVRVRMRGVHASPAASWHPGFASFTVSLSSVEAALAGVPGWLDEEIVAQHGHLSFQQPDKIAAAMRLGTPTPLWPTVAADLSTDAASVKRQLKLIVDRRNKIAHEADLDPTPPSSRYPITRTLVDDALDFLDSVAESISRIP